MNADFEVIKTVTASAGVLLAAGFDWKLRKIPNAVTFPMVALGLILHFAQNGFSGAWESMLGLGAGILLLFLPFAMGGVGGGDVKLLGALGSLLGPQVIFHVFLASAIFGGLFSLLVMLRQKMAGQAFRKIKHQAFYFFLTHKLLPLEQSASNAKPVSIPYAYAIGCGTLFMIFAAKGGFTWTF